MQFHGVVVDGGMDRWMAYWGMENRDFTSCLSKRIQRIKIHPYASHLPLRHNDKISRSLTLAE